MEAGDRIYNLMDLSLAVTQKKAVVVPESWIWRKPKPAAVFINLQGKTILEMINRGMFIYKKEVEK